MVAESIFSSVQSLSCVRPCNPMNRSTPGLPVRHQLPESTQTHVHWVSDAIQPSYLIQPLPSSQSHLSVHFVQASPSAPTSLSVPTEVSSVSMLLNPAAFFLVLILLELITYMVMNIVLTGPCWGSHLFLCLFVPFFCLDPSDWSFSVSQIFGSWWLCLWQTSFSHSIHLCHQALNHGFSSKGFQPSMHPCPDLRAGYHLWAWNAEPSRLTLAAGKRAVTWPRWICLVLFQGWDSSSSS